jgi:hypothetical protein
MAHVLNVKEIPLEVALQQEKTVQPLCSKAQSVSSTTFGQTRKAIYEYLQRNIEARSCNHCCSGQVMSNAQPECVYL